MPKLEEAFQVVARNRGNAGPTIPVCLAARCSGGGLVRPFSHEAVLSRKLLAPPFHTIPSRPRFSRRRTE